METLWNGRFPVRNVPRRAVSFIRRIVVLRSQHQVLVAFMLHFQDKDYVTEADRPLGRARQLEE